MLEMSVVTELSCLCSIQMVLPSTLKRHCVSPYLQLLCLQHGYGCVFTNKLIVRNVFLKVVSQY